MTNKEKNKYMQALELINELYCHTFLDDEIMDHKKESGMTHDDDLHLAHLIILKDQVLDCEKEYKSFRLKYKEEPTNEQ